MKGPKTIEVVGVEVLLSHLALRYGVQNLFDGIQESIQELFKKFRESENTKLKESNIVVWLDDEPTGWKPQNDGLAGAKWRFYLSSESLPADTLIPIAETFEKNDCWKYSGKIREIPINATPLFEYDHGEAFVYFIKGIDANGDEKIGYLDLEYNSPNLSLVFIEMDEQADTELNITHSTDQSIKFKIKFIQDILPDKSVTILSHSDMQPILSKPPVSELKGMSPNAPKDGTKVFYLMKPDENVGAQITMFTKRIHDALDFASISHNGQSRKDPDVQIPYVSHLFAVAYMLAHYNFPEEVIIAGLLHDIHEDVIQKQGKWDLEDVIKARYGKHVYDLIYWVTQRKTDELGNKISWEDRVDAYINRIRTAPPDAKAISCADKIHNIQSLILGFERGQRMWENLKSTPREQIDKFKKLHSAMKEGWEHPILERFRAIISDLEKYLPPGDRRSSAYENMMKLGTYGPGEWGKELDRLDREEEERDFEISRKVAQAMRKRENKEKSLDPNSVSIDNRSENNKIDFPRDEKSINFWNKFPDQEREFENKVREGLLCEAVTILPTPPRGYEWHPIRGGMIDDTGGSPTFRLWSVKLGYFPQND